MAVEDERLVEERAQRELGRMANRLRSITGRPPATKSVRSQPVSGPASGGCSSQIGPRATGTAGSW